MNNLEKQLLKLLETIERGRPYTLKLTKTQAAYELELENWKEDVGLLEQIQGLFK